jgi:DcuC family C4-dicarboxylate transporter
MVWVGLIILILTIVALVKRLETRMVLIAAGFIMAILSLNPMAAFNGFTDAMTNKNLVMNIVSVMGFAYVMNMTKCNAHLVHGATGVLKYVGFLLIPGAVFLTFAINIALPSAAGCAAAVGAILIPLLIGQGVNPAMAASAVMMGTFGSMLSPGLTHNIFVQDLTTKFPTYDAVTKLPTAQPVPATVMEVIARHSTVDIISVVICAVCLAVLALLFKEHKGYVDTEGKFGMGEKIKVNYLYALMPAVPVLLLVFLPMIPKDVLPKGWVWITKLGVAHCMLIGTFLGFVVTRTNPAEATKAFFTGGGKGYADVMGIIIAAGVFTAGLKAIGLVDAGIALMKSSQHAASLAAAFGPYVLGIITGSGDAATLAFNQAITSQAAQFHMTIVDMGSLATLGGCLGRTMSPLAGAAIVCAGLALVNPLEILKRNWLGTTLALIVSYFVFTNM